MARDRTLLAVDLLLATGVFLVDMYLLPDSILPAGPYAAPILIGAYFLSLRGVVVVAAYTIALLMLSAWSQQTPPLEVALDQLGLVMIGYLSTMLAAKMKRERELKVQAVELAEQRQRVVNTLRTLIETMPAGVLVSDAEGRIVLANGTADLLLGGPFTATTSAGMGSRSLHYLDGSPIPPEEQPLSRALERGEAIRELEMVVRSQGGTERALLVGSGPVRDESGAIAGAVAIFQNLAKRVRAEEQLLQARQLEVAE